MNSQSMLDKFKKFISPPSPNLNLSKHVPQLLEELGPHAKVLELGCGKRRRAGHIVNADLVPYPEVDVATDAHHLAFRRDCFDAVIVDAMLEHVSDPQAVVRQIYDVLKPGGYIYCEIPFLQMYHPAPKDFQRYTVEGIDRLFAGFNKIETGVAVGPTSAVCGMLQEYVPMLINIPVIRTILYYFIGWTGALLRYLDIFLVRNKNAHILASSLYYFGRK